MSLDFSNAQLPRLLPLEASFTENEVESDLKRLFIDIFSATLASDVFDVNVLGAAHLGSFGLVRRAVNADGLALLQGDREEAATRYLYRAWKSGNTQGRGLHFLRTYLQMLFPNQCEVEQLWQDKAFPYPEALYSSKPSFAWWLHYLGEPDLKLDGTWGLGQPIEGAEESRKDRVVNTSGMFLTSRIMVSLSFDVNTQSIAKLFQIIRDVIPARLLPIFRFWLNVTFADFLTSAEYALRMRKRVTTGYPWCGRVLSDYPDRRWRLGVDGEPARLPLPFGTFHLGRLYGAKDNGRLRNCQASGSLAASLFIDSLSVRLPPDLRFWLNAAITATDFLTSAEYALRMRKRVTTGYPWCGPSGEVVTSLADGDTSVWRVETLPMDMPAEYTPPIPPTKLCRVRRIDGSWRLGNRKMSISPRFGTFKIHDWKPPVLLPPVSARLTLSGNWKLGGHRNPEFDFYVIKE
jgi:hypothetical protein